jgi:hypothetical protein
MNLNDFEVGDTVVVTPECATSQLSDKYDFSAWGQTRMRVTGIGDVFVELVAIDARPDWDYLMRNRHVRDLRGFDPNELSMFWLPEQLKKIA